MKPAIGLSDERRAGVISLLNVLLSDEYLLYTKARNYHWNVFGPQFNDLHKFFEGHYEQLEEVVDEVAERARSLGGFAFGTMAEFAQHTRLREQPKDHPDARHMLAIFSPITNR
jgi:starvation-inducible DNA-binding protein